MNEMYCPKIKRTYSVIGHDHSMVELRKGGWFSESFYMHDESCDDQLYNIIANFNGETTIKDLMQKYDVEQNDLRQVLSALQKEDLLEEKPHDAMSYYLDTITPLMNDFHFDQSFNDIRIMGDVLIGDEIIRQLKPLVDQQDIVCTRVNLKEYNDFIGEDPAWPYDSLKKAKIRERFAPWKNSFIVYVSRFLNPFLLQYFNLIAKECGLTWMLAMIDGPLLLVGPTFTSATACFECFEKRILQNMQNNANYLDYKKALASGRFSAASNPIMMPIENLVASYVALDISNYVLAGTNHTNGKCMSIYLPTMETVYHDILKSSQCRVCGISQKPQKNTHFELQSLLEERDNVIQFNQKSEQPQH